MVLMVEHAEGHISVALINETSAKRRRKVRQLTITTSVSDQPFLEQRLINIEVEANALQSVPELDLIIGVRTPSLRTAFFEEPRLGLLAEQDTLHRQKPEEYLTGDVAFVFGVDLLKEPF